MNSQERFEYGERIKLRRTSGLLAELANVRKTYMDNIGATYAGYASTRARILREASALKDEQGYIERGMKAHNKDTRANFAKMQEEYHCKMCAIADELRGRLRDAFKDPVRVPLLNSLSVYTTYNIKPSRTEVETLVDMAGGNYLGIKAIGSVLDKLDCDYKLAFDDANVFESDLDTLKAFAAEAYGSVVCANHDFLIDACELWKDSVDGANPYADDGYVIAHAQDYQLRANITNDSTRLTLKALAEAERNRKIDEINSRWAQLAVVGKNAYDDKAVFNANIEIRERMPHIEIGERTPQNIESLQA